MTALTTVSLAVALTLAAVHVLGPSMRFLRVVPRSIWLSLAGGASVAYVFVHLLPELAIHEEAFQARSEDRGLLGTIEGHAYVIALLGLAVFYGLELVARSSASRADRGDEEAVPSRAAFWLHVASFAAYNVLIGYLLLHREETDLLGLLIYGFTMALHFVVNDQGLREHHGRTYDGKARWILAAAPLLGWGVGMLADVPVLAVSSLFAFLAGSIVLNVLKEELPEERESRFWAFATGASLYTVLLLAIG